MRFKEAGILANDVHDVGGDDSFVIFAAFNLAKPQEIFDDGH